MFKLEFDFSGDAFAETRLASEIGRILHKVATRVMRDGATEGAIVDVNGNTVGQWSAR